HPLAGSPPLLGSRLRRGTPTPGPYGPGSDSAGCPVAFFSVPALRLGSLAGGPRGRPGPAPRRVRGLPSFDQKPKPGIVAKEREAEPQPVGRDVGFSEPTSHEPPPQVHPTGSIRRRNVRILSPIMQVVPEGKLASGRLGNPA